MTNLLFNCFMHQKADERMKICLLIQNKKYTSPFGSVKLKRGVYMPRRRLVLFISEKVRIVLALTELDEILPHINSRTRNSLDYY